MNARLRTLSLRNRRHFLVPALVARYHCYRSRREATWCFRFLYTAVEADPIYRT